MEVIMVKLASFPGVSRINNARTTLFSKSHNIKLRPSDRDASKTTQIACWLGHKAVSLISLPANGVAIGLGLAGMTATACTLGAFKVFTYAVTLGNIKPKFSIGFLWLGERTFTSFSNIFKNVEELGYDTARLAYNGYRGVKSVLTALKLNYLIPYIKQAIEFIGKRIDKGIDVAGKDEESLPTPQELFRELNKATIARSCFKGEQPISRWFEHKALSMINIPVNVAVATLSGVACLAGAVAFTAKVTLYAATNIHISTPTGAGYTGWHFANASYNTLRNSAEVVADLAVIVYRIADALHITQAVVAVKNVIEYIPKAILT